MSQNRVIDELGVGVTVDPPPVVHLELHTRNLSAASDFYARLLRWRSERIDTDHGRYLALGIGGPVCGGVVECDSKQPLWLPYVEVDHIDAVTDRARALGATVLLEPREGPSGWRSVVSAADAGEVALWQGKEWR
jgi:predicted enzyme related to lactoylglutathione lyase